MVEPALKDVIQQKYGEAARRAAAGEEKTGCCGTGCGCADPITSELYGAAETSALPAEAVAASLGCGNPTALIDLGKGKRCSIWVPAAASTCCCRPARRTHRQSLRPRHDGRDAGARAREPAKAGATNVEFLKGEIEHDPAPGQFRGRHHLELRDQPVGRQGRVLREAFRVLKPGGRFAVSDVVVRGDVPAEVRRSVELWVGCVAGALARVGVPRDCSRQAGFADVEVEPWRVYNVERCAGVSHERGHRRRRDRAAGGRQVRERIRPRTERVQAVGGRVQV